MINKYNGVWFDRSPYKKVKKIINVSRATFIQDPRIGTKSLS